VVEFGIVVARYKCYKVTSNMSILARTVLLALYVGTCFLTGSIRLRLLFKRPMIWVIW